jgi:hypothetical protein
MAKRLNLSEMNKLLEKSREVLVHSLNEDIKRYDVEMENWNLRVGSEISNSIASKVLAIDVINKEVELPAI